MVTQKTKLSIHRLGLSLVNSHARELCYTTFTDLRLSFERQGRDEKVNFRVGDI